MASVARKHRLVVPISAFRFDWFQNFRFDNFLAPSVFTWMQPNQLLGGKSAFLGAEIPQHAGGLVGAFANQGGGWHVSH